MYRVEKGLGGKEEIVIEGFQAGIAASPHAGIADLKNININSFTGEAAVNYERVNTLPVISGGAISSPTGAAFDYVFGSNPKLVVGSCIVPTASNITNLTVGKPYWVTSISTFSTYQSITLANRYGAAFESNFGNTGTATFGTFSLNKFIQGATEYDEYNNAYIYYLCDSNGVVWVNDSNVYGVFAPAGDTNGTSVASNATGFAVSQGVAFVFAKDSTGGGIWWNFTKTIGVYNNWAKSVLLNTPPPGDGANHYALSVPDQNGSVYYCDSQWLGQISSIAADTAGTQRYTLMDVSCDGSTSSLTISKYLQGTTPGDALPVCVFAKPGTTLPTGLSSTTQYFIKTGDYSQSGGTVVLATVSGGGTAVTPSTAGSFYISSFTGDSANFSSIVSYTKQALALPYYEIANCIGQFSQGGGLTLIIGTLGNNVYFWTPGTSAPSGVLPLPEYGAHRILNVDNTAYIFTGNKGNIYISNGTVLAGALTIPDYVANPLGTNQDPYFSWGDCIFLRGRVFFSVQDQHSGNTTGNCGGVWSFSPTQNLFLGQDVGTQLHLENENSYGSYNGICDVLLPSYNQEANGPQYWSAWSSDYNSPTYGIDFSGTVPYNSSSFATANTAYGQIDTDIIPVGTYLTKYTPTTIEYKVSRPLISGESVELQWRPDLTTAFSSIGTDSTVGNLAYPFPTKAQTVQWLQFRAKLTSANSSSASFVPLTEIRIRP